MKAGGIFGGNALGSLSEGNLGPQSYQDALNKARATGCEDATARRPLDISRAISMLDKWASDSKQEYAIYEAYRSQYALCTPGKQPEPSGPAKETGVMAAIKEAGQSLIGEDLAPGPLTPSPGTGTRLTVPAGACTSDAVIKAVQAIIGVDADGKWGPKSQAALKASGETFRDHAKECSGNVPFYGGSGLTTAPPTMTTPGTAPKPPLLGSMGNLTSSPVFWALALAAGIGGYLYLSKPQKGKRGSQR